MDRRIVAATEQHLQAMIGRIRTEDAQELADAYDQEPDEVLRKSYYFSRLCWAAVVDGVVIALFGVAPRGEWPCGRPWMVGTADLDRHRFKFGKGCRDVIEQMLMMFPDLENVVDCRNEKAIRWLMWLGFEFRETVQVGVKALPYYVFRMRRD